MEFLTQPIDRRPYIYWTLCMLGARLLCATPVIILLYTVGAVSPYAYAFAIAVDVVTLVILLILNTRRLSAIGQPRSLALLTLLPVVKFALILYLCLIPSPASEGGATAAKALGLHVPATLLARADEAIE